MDEHDFVLFVPRLVGNDESRGPSEPSAGTAACGGSGPPDPLPAQSDVAGCELELTAGPAPEQHPQTPVPEAQVKESGEADRTFRAELEGALQRARREADIRHEAVRLACIAAGRILRHAIAFDPMIVARFVDDALAAVQDADASVRVNGAHLAVLRNRGSQCRADEHLSLGEVVVELPRGSLGATLEERAALAVRAAADN